MEYNNSFDALIKKAVENAEMPLPTDAWNEFEKFRAAGIGHSGLVKSQSFFTHFIAAGVALAITVGAINLSSGSADHTNEMMTSHEATSGSEGLLQNSANAGSMVSADAIDSETLAESTDEPVLDALTDNITETEKGTIVRINDKLNRVASESPDEEGNSLRKGKRTTKYVGKDFNLDAASLFSPNGDGTNDSFIPSALTTDDKFEMVVRDESDNILFKTSDVNMPWTGMDLSDKEMPEGKYRWSVLLKENETNSIFRGTVKLLRR